MIKVVCENQKTIEAVLDQVGEDVTAEELENALINAPTFPCSVCGVQKHITVKSPFYTGAQRSYRDSPQKFYSAHHIEGMESACYICFKEGGR